MAGRGSIGRDWNDRLVCVTLGQSFRRHQSWIPVIPVHPQFAPVERRVAAIEAVFEARGMEPKPFIESLSTPPKKKGSRNGARVVAKAWTDPAFRQRLLANGKSAVAELGLTMPPHHRHLVALENTPTVHNVIVCTLCSCTAFTIIGLPPDWYKDLDYRARAVRESRTVLREMGLDLPPEIEIGCGTRRRIPATWCFPCSHPRPLAGRKKSWWTLSPRNR